MTLRSKAALEGERKQIIVGFADLNGSEQLRAARVPKEARRLINPDLERMMEAVHHCVNTVHQILGNGIMALFRAPIAREDHTFELTTRRPMVTGEWYLPIFVHLSEPRSRLLAG
jgi:class 3 adenylate cyclase